MADITAKQKEFISERARGCCEYCYSQLKFSPDPFSIEHIIPLSKGGTYVKLLAKTKEALNLLLNQQAKQQIENLFLT